MDPVTREWERLESFCSTYGVPATVEVAPLYLTWLAEQGSDVRAIARAVTALNAAASRRGEPSWSADEGVERWLRGFLRGEPFGRTGERGAPLYREHVLALAEACLAPTRQQRLQVAAVVLANETGLSAGALARLQWGRVRLRASSVEIAPPDFEKRGPRNSGPVTLDSTGGATCPVTALRALRGGPSRFVLDGKGNFTTDGPRIVRYLKPLPPPSKGGYRSRERLDTPALAGLCAQLLVPGPQPSRDLALITISHGAALRGHEAIALRQGHVQVSRQTLKITIYGRREPIYLPSQPNSPACPVQAWTQWKHHLIDQARNGDEQRAFLRVSGSNIWDRPMTPSGLNYVVDQRVGHAQLTGEFVYTSLRIGTIRGWIRDGRRDLLVARDAGLLSLASVERHERRETILSHSVAGMVGL